MAEERWGSLRPLQRPAARPFLKWAGGKGQALSGLKRHLPTLGSSQTYYEPFLGGGAVFFHLSPPNAVLGDLNRSLIATYIVVKDNLSELLAELQKLKPPTDEENYYAVRDTFNDLRERLVQLSASDRARFAALFIWLNHTCYNGLYRVNKKGRFNVPFGFYQNPSIYSAAVLRQASRALRAARTRILAADYEEVLSGAVRGDVAYLDPPYDPVSSTARFTSYTSDGFDKAEQERLAGVVDDLVRRGCRVILSNSPSKLIKRLYGGYRTETVSVPRAINCVGSRRTRVAELVVIAG
jgi:DNA adenine methylase